MIVLVMIFLSISGICCISSVRASSIRIVLISGYLIDIVKLTIEKDEQHQQNLQLEQEQNDHSKTLMYHIWLVNDS